MTYSEKQFIIEVTVAAANQLTSNTFINFQVKELTCDTFKSRCKLKKLPREKAIVEHIHLVRSVSVF